LAHAVKLAITRRNPADPRISPGMKRGIADAEAAERPVEYRLLAEST
jgi:hypothetical protein